MYEKPCRTYTSVNQLTYIRRDFVGSDQPVWAHYLLCFSHITRRKTGDVKCLVARQS